MNTVFYAAAIMAIVTTGLVVTRFSAVYALLFLVASLMSAALVFYVFGAPFIAALEIIIYAGAIMVLFIFVIMMLNLGPDTVVQEHRWMNGRMWIGPCILVGLLIAELLFVLAHAGSGLEDQHVVEAKEVGQALFGPYVLAVELSSMLLLSGLVGAYFLGRRDRPREGGL